MIQAIVSSIHIPFMRARGLRCRTVRAGAGFCIGKSFAARGCHHPATCTNHPLALAPTPLPTSSLLRTLSLG